MGLLRALRERTGRDDDQAEQPAPAVVSVVVPVYQAGPYLEECLTSARDQTYPHLQIVVIDDGSTDDGAAIAARHAAQDERITVHRQENAGLGAARNAGIALASGTYLTFLDADDTVPDTAYELMVRSLEDSGSDFVIGAVQRVTGPTRRIPRWVADVHDRDRRAVTVEDVPWALMDVIACNRLFRKQFWDDAGLVFPEGVAYEDHLPMVAAYVRAHAFDILEATTYHWRIREDGSSLGQQKHRVENLQDRLTAKRAAWDVLRVEASPAVQRAWRVRVLDMDLPLFVEQLPGADDDWVEVLTAGVREHLAAADEEVLRQVRTGRRVKEQLLSAGRRDEVELLLAQERVRGPVPYSSVVDGEVYAEYPGLPGPPLSAEDRRLVARETVLRASLRRCWWREPGVLEVDVSAFVPYVDLTGLTQRASAWWVDDQGERVAAALRSYSDPEITRDEQPTGQVYDAAGLRTTLTVGDLPDPTRTWHLEVEVDAAGVVRRGVVRYRDGRGSAGDLRASVLPDGTRVILEHNRRDGLVVTTRPPVATLVAAEVAGSQLALTAAAPGVALRRLAAAARGRQGQVGADVGAPGSPASVRLPLVRLGECSPERRWTLRAVWEGDKAPLTWPGDAAAYDLLPVPGAATLRVRRSAAGTAVLQDTSRLVVVTSARISAAEVELALRWEGSGAPPTDVALQQGSSTVPLRQDAEVWTLPGGPDALPADGEWRLQVGAADAPAVLVLATSVLADLPLLVSPPDTPWRALLVRTRGSGLAVLREPRDWSPAGSDD